jgi:acylphosphatase
VSEEEEQRRARLVVRGRVQGVGFREAVRRRAQARGLPGWVRNRPDGSLEAVFEGRAQDVEALAAFCREGPRSARVQELERSNERPEGLTGFEVR